MSLSAEPLCNSLDWWNPSPCQAAGRSASKKWSYCATWHSLADTSLTHADSSSSSSIFSEFILLFMTSAVKKPRKWIERQRCDVQPGDKNSKSLYCQYLVHALTGWVIKTISPQETLLFTYCTSVPLILAQMALCPSASSSAVLLYTVTTKLKPFFLCPLCEKTAKNKKDWV